jgi:ATP/maltotriose-dependent transcriptional regulator MalT
VAALVESLTERELEVLRLLAARRCNAGIAAELFVEQSTVKTHLNCKLGRPQPHPGGGPRAAAAG